MSRHTTTTSASSATVSILRVAMAAAAALALVAPRAEAQDLPTRSTVELRPVVGALLPTGDQRDLLDEAVLVGAQASYALTPNFAVIGTFGWSPSKDRLLGGEKLDLFQYDVGLEGRLGNLTPASRAAYSWRQVAGAGALAGIGFTMSLFIAGQSLQGDDFAAAKIAIFAGSLLAGALGTAILWRREAPAGARAASAGSPVAESGTPVAPQHAVVALEPQA